MKCIVKQRGMKDITVDLNRVPIKGEFLRIEEGRLLRVDEITTIVKDGKDIYEIRVCRPGI